MFVDLAHREALQRDLVPKGFRVLGFGGFIRALQGVCEDVFWCCEDSVGPVGFYKGSKEAVAGRIGLWAAEGRKVRLRVSESIFLKYRDP